MITTTLARIRAHGPSPDAWSRLLAGLGKSAADNEPLTFARIVEISGLDDALWCCRAEPQYDREWRLFAVWCARQVQHLMTDPRSTRALDVAEQHACGLATAAELEKAKTAAWAADAAAWAAEWAARAAAWAARAALAAEATAARAAAEAEAEAWAAAWAAEAEADAAAEAATRAAQTAEFLRVVTETEARS